jgi:hypothetical protein
MAGQHARGHDVVQIAGLTCGQARVTTNASQDASSGRHQRADRSHQTAHTTRMVVAQSTSHRHTNSWRERPSFRRGAASRVSQGFVHATVASASTCVLPSAGGKERHPKLEAPAIGSPVRTTAWRPLLVADLKLRRRFTRSAASDTAEAKHVRTLWPPLRPHPWLRGGQQSGAGFYRLKWAQTAGRERPPGRGRDAEGAHRGGSLTPPLR